MEFDDAAARIIRCGAVEPGRAHLLPDLREVDAVRERTAQHLGQPGDGGEHRDGVTMDEHPIRIRIDGADVIQRKHVIRET